MLNNVLAHNCSDFCRIRVKQRLYLKPARGEASVPGERLAEVSNSDEYNWPILGQPHGTRDLMS